MPGRQIGTHILRHRFARHLLLNGIPLNYLSRWLCHSTSQAKPIYLESVPHAFGNRLTPRSMPARVISEEGLILGIQGPVSGGIPRRRLGCRLAPEPVQSLRSHL